MGCHHYLQHPGHTRLKETMNAAIYWKEMQTTIRSFTKSFKSCQVNKRRTLKYGHLPSKIVISTPWEALCVNLVCPYTLKGKDGSELDCMALTMIDPASSWFETVELPLVNRLPTKMVNSKQKVKEELIFDKSSNQIARLVNKIWLCRYCTSDLNCKQAPCQTREAAWKAGTTGTSIKAGVGVGEQRKETQSDSSTC